MDAAAATQGIEKKPKPFVHVTTLGDFYVEYEVNGYTRKSETLGATYSALRQNILDSFNKAGVEIMVPHVVGLRENLKTQIPQEDTSF